MLSTKLDLRAKTDLHGTFSVLHAQAWAIDIDLV